jgi:FkbM family methyltransferase
MRIPYRVAAIPLVGYPLLLCWKKGWIPNPGGCATALLKDGRRLRCQLADRTQRTMYLGLFEPRETRLLGRLLECGDTFIDVGAHIGWFATMASRCVRERGHVVACEPYPSNAAMLKVNLALNGCRNVRVVEAAASSRPGTIALAGSGGDSGSVTALSWAREGRVQVPATTLDEIVGDVSRVALMKVDVEGWEAHVLRGADQTLSHTERVLIEINPEALRKAESSADEVFGLLRRAGFTNITPVVQGGLRRLHRSAVSNALATRSARPGRPASRPGTP